MKSALITVLLAMALVSCDAPSTSEYQGAFLFGQGPYLMRYSLQDGSLSVAGHLGDTSIREIGPLGPDHLLITESASVNDRRVSRISWFELETGQSAALYSGGHALFLDEAAVIVYDDGSNLFAVPQMDGSANTVIFEHGKNQLKHLVRAAPGTVLFESGEVGQTVVRSWDSQAEQLKTLEGLTESCRLRGSVWIEPMQRLACKTRDGGWDEAPYVLASIDGTIDGTLNLPEDKQFLALNHIESLNALVLQGTWSGMLGAEENHGVWMYDLASGTSQRLPGNVKLGTSVFYTEF
jgi:hypothetical protein